MQKAVLKTRYFTPQEARIDQHKSLPEKRHLSIVLNPVVSTNKSSSHENKEIDGFLLLEAAKLDFPEDVQCLILSDKNLYHVVDEDLTYFSELLYLDVSENHLPFIPFGALPKLTEFRMACNDLRTIDNVYGFNHLMYLDLSYNSLSPESILSLSVLPFLKELDLCGNSLSSLPSDLSGFIRLEKLLLEYNKFDNNRIFQILSSLPNIRFLGLSHNYLSFIPKECCEYGGLRLLEVLDLAFNYFGTEESIEAIVLMNRLKTLLIYGNPVLGPSGEDPAFIYIETLVDKASQIRQAGGGAFPDVEFITEIPRKRCLKKGRPLGRHALYRDFSVVQVNESNDALNKGKPWKKKGTVTPFVEAMSNRKALHSSGQVHDFTFITGGATTSSVAKTQKESEEVDDADEVMQKIAIEMGLIGSEELELFQEYTQLSPRPSADYSTSFLAEETNNSSNYLRNSVERAETFSPPQPTSDHLPNTLFQGRTGQSYRKQTTTVPTQPIALRTAMRELQRALDQPLTNYDEIPSKHSSKVKDCYRGTTISKIRQLPRVVSEPTQQSDANKLATAEHKKEQHQKTLHQINSVIDKLNDTSEKMFPQSAASETVSNPKKSMETMRNFAKPQSVRGLVNMVQNIIQEFNS